MLGERQELCHLSWHVGSLFLGAKAEKALVELRQNQNKWD
jgi:hypothetical protein